MWGSGEGEGKARVVSKGKGGAEHEVRKLLSRVGKTWVTFGRGAVGGLIGGRAMSVPT